MPRYLIRIVLTCALIVAGVVSTGWAQRWQRFRFEPNAEYDGRFTFARIRYTEYRSTGWAFDYPTMERNLMLMMEQVTALRPHVRESNIHTLDDPELMKYPIAYLSEPGYWVPSDSEVEGLRTYLRKGGFLIVDDFFGNQWDNFERQIMTVLPDARIERLEITHPVFQSFFSLQTLEGMHHPQNPYYRAEYLGIYEDNDKSKRLAVIINYNNDIGDYMEWSGQGWYPVDFSNDAYKFATNYIVYGLTR